MQSADLLAKLEAVGVPGGPINTLDQVFCFGNCALGPSVTVDATLHGRVDPERLDALVAAARSRAGVPA